MKKLFFLSIFLLITGCNYQYPTTVSQADIDRGRTEKECFKDNKQVLFEDVPYWGPYLDKDVKGIMWIKCKPMTKIH